MRHFKIKNIEEIQEFLDYVTELQQPVFIFQSPDIPHHVIVSQKNISENKLEVLFEKEQDKKENIVGDDSEPIFTEEDFENEEWLLYM